jgi:hypothetical protein
MFWIVTDQVSLGVSLDLFVSLSSEVLAGIRLIQTFQLCVNRFN